MSRLAYYVLTQLLGPKCCSVVLSLFRKIDAYATPRPAFILLTSKGSVIHTIRDLGHSNDTKRQCYQLDSDVPIQNMKPLIFYKACPESKDTKVLNMYSIFNLQKRHCE